MPQTRNRPQSLVRNRGQKRSRKGCSECRRRKIKCDEQQPRCGQCRKANRNCRLQDSIFRQHELSIRYNDLFQGDQGDEDNLSVDVSEAVPGHSLSRHLSDTSRADPSVDQEETSAGNDVQIADERIAGAGTTAWQSSLFRARSESRR
ncbi:hypothetical protein FJTKL_01811 [Diaporthe vaccinii]|uniref:Zn(2)-C6 fungal-type domain-containing protein n=1 Tax=Diaporthe vaccinii TaxID=105482 RepID=A0ABR4F4C6_9PEZI